MKIPEPMTFALSLASVAFLLTVVWGRPLINLLRRKKIGKQIRIEGPNTHQVKMGTPTMGGVLFLVPVFVITVVLNLANLLSGVTWGKRILAIFNFAEGSSLIGKSILVPLLTLVAFGLLGARDDWAGIRGQRSDGQGLVARIKASYSVILALIISAGIYFVLDIHSVAIPGITTKIDLGLIYIPIAAFIIVGSSHAVNLTDGLGWAGRLNLGGGICGLRHHRQPAEAVSAELVLLRHGRRAVRVPMVQLAPGATVHGGHRGAGAGRHARRRGADDRPMAAAPDRGPGLRRRGPVRHPAGELLQVDEAAHRSGQTHLQDGAAASPLRVARLVGDAGCVAFFHHRHPGWHVRHRAGAAVRMNELTQFRGILPPEGATAATPRPPLATPDGLILRTLSPFRDELDSALARGDRGGALRLAYTALSRIADELAAYRGDKLPPDQVRVHALLVELESLPLEPLPDGTLAERGTAVTVNYRNWAVDQPWRPRGRGHLPSSSRRCGPARGLWWGANEPQRSACGRRSFPRGDRRATVLRRRRA